MKVKYIQTYKDEYNDTYQPGWVAEHTDAEGARRIALGVCEEVNPEARAFKYKPDAPLSIDECVPPAQSEDKHIWVNPEAATPAFKGAKPAKA